MNNKIKSVLRFLLPPGLRIFLWEVVPKKYLINTYLLKRSEPIIKISSINSRFYIREVGWEDAEKLQKVYLSPTVYNRKIPGRLNAREWTGLAVFDKTNGDIAYLSWIITQSIIYLEEFNIFLREGQYLLKDGYCVPEYRHQGLHSRMEQERINYCINHGGREIFIQIHDSNEKGKESVLANGYTLFQQNHILHWPVFNIYRELLSFLKNPFRKVVK